MAEPVPAAAAGARPGRPASGYLPALDGLRAVSVAAVVAFHLGHLRGGFLGVDVFFVVSGFLITRLLLAEGERTGTIGLRAFWARRFRRLLPALFVVLAAVSFASKAWLPAWRLTGVRNDALAAIAYVANWRFSLSGQSYFAQGVGPSPLRHTWSLAIEEQFYVLWPIVVAALVALGSRGLDRRRRVGRVAGAVGLASALWMAVAAGTASDLSRVYYGTDTRVFALCAGAWLGARWDPWLAGSGDEAAHRRRVRGASVAAVVGLAALVVLVLAVPEDATWSYRGGFQLAAAAVAGLATGEGLATRLLALAPLRWVGRRSYGIYLWAWPVQVLVDARFGLGHRKLAAVVVVASVALAAASFALVEEPIRTGRWPFTRRTPRTDPRSPARTPGVAAAAVGLVAVLAMVTLPAIGSPAPPAYLRVSESDAVAAALAPGESVPGATTTTGPVNTTPPFPRTPLVVPADATADPASVRGRPLKVLITGDSVAWSLGAYLGDGLRVPVQVADRGIIACGIMPASADWIAGDNGPANYPHYCSKQAEADRLGLEGRPDVVVLWTGAWEVYDHRYDGRTYRVGTPAFSELLEHLLQVRVDRYRKAGIGTILPVVTCFGPTPPVFGAERLDPERVAWVNARLRAVADRNPGWVRMIDPNPVLCDADGASREAMPDGTGIRVDGAHFDENSAPWFWNTWLAGQVAASFG